MKQRLKHFWPALKLGLHHVKINWQAFCCTDEVQALRRAFRLFWWRLGDVIALFFRLIWKWFLNTRPMRAIRAWWHRTVKAVKALPQYQALCWFCRKEREHLWLRWATFTVLMILSHQ